MSKSPANSPPGSDRNWDDDADPWRHAPVTPKDAGLAESIGRSISEVVIGPLDDPAGKPKPTPAPEPIPKP